jgi:NADPH:quinone reductase-like Zn-dependent oxidoreductase
MSGEVVELGSGVTNLKPGDKVISISFPVTFSIQISNYYCLAEFPSSSDELVISASKKQ